ncbi:MAG: hypothetical protein ABI882_03245 [Acidobacteriota bacterium]
MKDARNDLLLRGGIVMCIAMFVIAGAIQMGAAQGPGPGPRPDFDPLRGLKHALEDASAPALSSEQESSLTALVKAFHDSMPKPGPDDPIRAAHKALDQAILAGDAAAAQAQATTIATAEAAAHGTRLRAEVAFQVQVLNILKTNAAQYTALVQRFGAAGLPGLLRSPLGPGGPGGGPGGPRRGGFGHGGPGGPGDAPGRPEGGPRRPPND